MDVHHHGDNLVGLFFTGIIGGVLGYMVCSYRHKLGRAPLRRCRSDGNRLKWDSLPDDLIIHELSKYLNIKDIGRITQTSKRNRIIFSDDCVWKLFTKGMGMKWYKPKDNCALDIFNSYMKKHYFRHEDEPMNDSNMKIKSWVHHPKLVNSIGRALACQIEPQYYVDPEVSLPDLSIIERRIIRLIFYPSSASSAVYRASDCTWKQYVGLPRVIESKHAYLIHTLVDITEYARDVQEKGLSLYTSLNSLFCKRIIEHHSWFPNLCSHPRVYSSMARLFE